MRTCKKKEIKRKQKSLKILRIYFTKSKYKTERQSIVIRYFNNPIEINEDIQI